MSLDDAEDFASQLSGEVTDDWQERVTLVRERDAAVRAAERERIAKLVDENADVYLKKTQETGDDVCAVYAILQSRLAAKIRAMGDEKP